MSQGQGDDVTTLYDKNGNPVSVRVKRGEAQLVTINDDVVALLTDILQELKELREVIENTI